MTSRWRETTEDGGIFETITRYSFEGHPPAMMAYAPSWERRWVRRPRSALHAEFAGAGAAGCVNPMSIVDEDDQSYTYLGAQGVLAYHPDDAGRWYKTAAACQAALRTEGTEPRPADDAVL